MKLSQILISAAIVVTLQACGGGEGAIAPDQACGEQAEMFCDKPLSLDPVSRASCVVGYMSDCMPHNPGVSAEAHIGCLDALVSSDNLRCVPLACAATWGDPDRVAHFCRI